jgi:starch synthase
MNRQIVLAHPFGNANVRQALSALHKAGMLRRFITTISADHVGIRKILPQSIQLEIGRRSFSPLPKSFIEPHASLEAFRLIGNRVGRKYPWFSRFFPTVDDVWRAIDESLYKMTRDNDHEQLSVYAYEDGAFKTFSLLKRSRKVYELPIGYWKSMHQILGEESETNSDWAVTLSGLRDSQDKLDRKDQELALAHQIVVPSDFVASTLPVIYQKRTTTIPYGCPPPITDQQITHSQGGPLKVFFCGSLGQRKGLSYLFDAVAKMGSHAELTIVGSEVAPCPALTRALQKTRYFNTLPHQKVLELMRLSDVMVFPTLFEGRALVVLEALSQGIPVITTINSGTADVIVDGKSGFLVPVRSTEAIHHALQLLHQDRELLSHMKFGALQIAKRSGWDGYQEKLVNSLTVVKGLSGDESEDANAARAEL